MTKVRKWVTAFGTVYILPSWFHQDMGEPLSEEEEERFNQAEKALSHLSRDDILEIWFEQGTTNVEERN